MRGPAFSFCDGPSFGCVRGSNESAGNVCCTPALARQEASMRISSSNIIVHSFGFLSVTVSHSHINAPYRPEGKSNTTAGFSSAVTHNSEECGIAKSPGRNSPRPGRFPKPGLRCWSFSFRIHLAFRPGRVMNVDGQVPDQ